MVIDELEQRRMLAEVMKVADEQGVPVNIDAVKKLNEIEARIVGQTQPSVRGQLQILAFIISGLIMHGVSTEDLVGVVEGLANMRS